MDGLGETDIVQDVALRNRPRVFRDRTHAGEALGEMLTALGGTNALVCAVPAGGVPVAVVVAQRLGLELEIAVVSKITLPWNTEAGYGAVAFDGTVRLNRRLVESVGLTEDQVERGIATTQRKVERRAARFRAEREWPPLANRTVVLVDDGLASGFTMLVAVEALRSLEAEHIVVAVPTAPEDTVLRIAERAHAVYCVNVRQGRPFAVADAYQRWCDVDENDAIAQFHAARRAG